MIGAACAEIVHKMQQYSSVVATNAEILHEVQQNQDRILKGNFADAEKVSITLPLPKLNRNMSIL
ncbi:hypothetical protein BSK66_25245 [Paenibacillus odorifer]|uniref:Uncharacterized protein n=2 Tax=Paenibacillus TaxID=44249 RepID=A0A1R0X1Y2_9BACL|nr:hypothetical protein C171_17691 [Paenibacillus sp. FSL H8-237]OMD27060.1 hypothetical protein BJP51_25750 [Paenibacillus odorifer]OME50444.1 hypothetical protein BSK66_25245 [Paenibacillus odorifer]